MGSSTPHAMRSAETRLGSYTVVPPGMSAEGSGLAHPVQGSPEDVARFIEGLGRVGFSEVRCDLHPKSVEAVETMASVVELGHAA